MKNVKELLRLVVFEVVRNRTNSLNTSLNYFAAL